MERPWRVGCYVGILLTELFAPFPGHARYSSAFASSIYLIFSVRPRSILRMFHAASLSSPRCAFRIPSYTAAASFERDTGGSLFWQGGFVVLFSFLSPEVISFYSRTSRKVGFRTHAVDTEGAFLDAEPLPRTLERSPVEKVPDVESIWPAGHREGFPRPWVEVTIPRRERRPIALPPFATPRPRVSRNIPKM